MDRMGWDRRGDLMKGMKLNDMNGLEKSCLSFSRNNSRCRATSLSDYPRTLRRSGRCIDEKRRPLAA